MASEKTIRRNGKWVKITHTGRGRYIVAQGWAGSFTARHIHRLTNAWKARHWADAWLNDLA
jgi:hypothetical protein